MKRPTSAARPARPARRALHGARGLKPISLAIPPARRRRALHGARGLKQRPHPGAGHRRPSRPSRGAWIETGRGVGGAQGHGGRALHGARGLKPCTDDHARHVRDGRALHGARGLKLHGLDAGFGHDGQSRPSRGAWIETPAAPRPSRRAVRRALHGARGLKQQPLGPDDVGPRVAPFTGRVD